MHETRNGFWSARYASHVRLRPDFRRGFTYETFPFDSHTSNGRRYARNREDRRPAVSASIFENAVSVTKLQPQREVLERLCVQPNSV